MKVGFVSLGCSKNLIDTEIAIGILKEHGMEIVNNPEDAEMIIVNTCGFIDPAKEEAINTILEMAEYKKKKCKYLVAMGCLVQRYTDELKKALPEVDLWIRLDKYDKFYTAIEELINNKVEDNKKYGEIKTYPKEPLPLASKEEFLGREISTGNNFAYLKIGEGCSNRCTYCAIPFIRGPFISRPEEDIIEEAKILAKKGIKELIIIAQDTTKYGLDLYNEPRLAKLLRKLCKIDGIEWIRFLYSYPEGIDDELIKVVKEESKICKYFDIPIQHISNSVLKRMNRKTSKQNIEDVITKIRTNISNVQIRTTVMVGFPGETQADFEELYEFVKKTKFDNLGAFTYSKEEGTPAARLKEQVHPMTKKARYNKIMELQQQVSKDNLLNLVGKEEKVLIEGITFDEKYYVGRTSYQVPDIDGITYIKSDKELTIGDFVNCTIAKSKEYDLIAKI
ncbi:MAG: ribosomal protein S12 methylthiotransferase RimO [Clostridium sp. CAG:354_28_25]|jgi:ribosomal protein S12 methylthiotransferase rimO|nr:MAG: ribosomal protein S12 methylthiotransferase RimO [Clostridium sp. CAG:354_28_25]